MIKNNLFQEWNPNKSSLRKITGGLDAKESFKIFRSSSSGFIKKQSVREIILSKCNYKCVYCSSSINLQIDHIVSVLKCFKSEMIFKCNTEENLQVLCNKCNAGKTS